jgi:hypothetical protein
MYNLLKTKKLLIAFAALTLLLSCATISKFDQYSYTQATSLKVDALNVMGNATDSFKLHQAQVATVQTELNKIYEYEKNKPKNTVTTKMWVVMVDSTGNLFGGFITRWQKEGKLDTAFIKESQIIIGQSFDQISELESGKIKATAIVN